MSQLFALPGYEVLEKIGEGGTSTVWKARQVSLDRLVAIKTLAPAHLPDSDALARFRQEAQAAARLLHPSIVQVFDAGEVEGAPYLVMEYVDGCSAADMLENAGPLEEARVLQIAEAVAHALGYAWDKDCIVHLDVKPDNVLLGRDGAVKITDLGLARFIGLNRQRAGDDLIIGTPNYVSPEQAQGVPDLDCRTDIYSLGATIYHLLTGQLPFSGSPGSSAMDRHVDEFLPDPQTLNATISTPAAWLVEKLMVKDRAYRPAYWSLVLADIAEVRAGRMPREPLPEPGRSTVARSAQRADPPKPQRAALRTAARTNAGTARRIVLKAGSPTPVAYPGREERSGLGRAFVEFLLVLVVAGAAFMFFHTGLHTRIGFRPSVASLKDENLLPPNTVPAAMAPDVEWDVVDANTEPPAAGAQVAGPSESPVAVAGDDSVPAAETPPGPGETIDWDRIDAALEGATAAPGEATWDDPVFARAAAHMESALRKYDAFVATRENPAVLKEIEEDTREAIRLFSEIRTRAPASANVNERMSRCFQLIFDLGQVSEGALDAPADPVAEPVAPKLQSPVAPPPPPPSRPPPPRDPAPPVDIP